jgi:hypothetical protein
MLDDSKNTKELSELDKLRSAREPFAQAAKAAEKALADYDTMLAQAERAEAKKQQDAALRTILPGDDASLLKGRDIQFLLLYTKDGGKGLGSLTGAEVTAAYKVDALVKTSGVNDVTVAARFFGSKGDAYLIPVKLDSKFGPGAFNPPMTTERDLLPATNAILTEGKPSTYIIVSDGEFSNKVEDIAVRLKAAADINTASTFDFVVCSKAEKTKTAELVQQLQELGLGQRVNLVQVAVSSDLTAVAKEVIKARLAGTVYTQPAVVAAAAATKKKTAQPSR